MFESITIAEFIFYFVLGWFMWKVIFSTMTRKKVKHSNPERKAVEPSFNQLSKEDQHKIISKVVSETLYVVSDAVPYKDQTVYLGLAAIDRKFLGQGNDLPSMFKQIFVRFPNKKVILYFPKGEKTTNHDEIVTINRDEVFN